MGRHFIVAVALALLAAHANAQPAAPPGAKPDRLCTTTTTVVKRGDVVISTTSSTRCEGEPGTGGGFNTGGMLAAPAAVFAAPEGLFKSLSSGGGVMATPKNVRGDWHTLEPGSSRVCHLFLTSQPTEAGLRVRTTDCHGPLARSANWRFENDAAVLYAPDGGVVARLRGEREVLQGQTEDGSPVTLQR